MRLRVLGYPLSLLPSPPKPTFGSVVRGGLSRGEVCGLSRLLSLRLVLSLYVNV